MFTNELVRLIENDSDELSKKWLKSVKKNPSAPTNPEFSEGIFYKRAPNFYTQHGHWISYETTKEEISRGYTAQGKKRFHEGFALYEVIYSLLILKEETLNKLLSEKSFHDVLDLSKVFDLSQRFKQFFDRALTSPCVAMVKNPGKTTSRPAFICATKSKNG